MRDWWRVNVEQPLDRLRIPWDTLFLYAWCYYAIITLLTGGSH